MTRFIEVTDVLAGMRLINLDHVTSIVPPSGVNDSCQLFLTTGGMYIIAETYEDVKAKLVHTRFRAE